MTIRPVRWMAMVAGGAAVLLVATVSPAAGLTNEVKLDSYAFDPPIRHISVGTSIRFRGHAPQAHTATSADGLWDSGALADGQTYTITFAAAGEYRYLCRFHPSQMTGTIFVDGPTPAPTPSPLPALPAAPADGGVAAAPAAPVAPAPAASAAATATTAPAEPLASRTAAPSAVVAVMEVGDEPVRAPAPADRPGPPPSLLALTAVLALIGTGLVGWEALERARRGY